MQSRQTLATFGCSWTYGIGAYYTPGLTKIDYIEQNPWGAGARAHSFRNILANKFNLTNYNLSKGGASNDCNFEQASAIFGDAKRKKKFLDSNPIVLWGITSTARIHRANRSMFLRPDGYSVMLFLEEPYINGPSNEDLKYILQNQELLYASLYLKLFYDHEQEVQRIGNQIEVWNDVFENYGVPVIWFDTFNHHKYPNQIRNFLQGGDLLSQMLDYKNLKYKSNKKWYHLSDWKNDDNRIDAGVKNQLLNPFSYHPSQDGHKILAEILTPSIQKLIN